MIKIFFSGTTFEKRFPVIASLESLIHKYNAWIEDHKIFAGQMANFIINIENQYFNLLVKDMHSLPVSWDFSFNEEKLSAIPPEREIQISITLNFIEEEPDFRKELPGD